MKGSQPEFGIYPLPLSGFRAVQKRIDELAQRHAVRLRLDVPAFLSMPGGMAAAFSAINSLHGDLFSVNPRELSDPEFARERAKSFQKQFIFDVQTHFVSDSYNSRLLLVLRRMAKRWNPELKGEKVDLDKVRFANYQRELFEKSDTKLAVLTSAPNDNPTKWFLHNWEMARARDLVNSRAGRKILYCHALITPRHPGWMERLDRAIAETKPDAWKCYTTGAPFAHSQWPWRLDDEKLMYPAYEKMVKSGIRNVCVHKGLLPPLYRMIMSGNWKYGMVDDLPRAAKDWPQLNFIIYHAAIEKAYPPSRARLREFEHTGYIPWVSDLAAMPAQYGLSNIYAEIGSTFAVSAISNPRYCTAILGALIKGMGADHVLWGTDSVWYGSPQWQIEAFRRIEIPDGIRLKFGYSELGPPDGPVKNMVFGENAARLYNVELEAAKKAA